MTNTQIQERIDAIELFIASRAAGITIEKEKEKERQAKERVLNYIYGKGAKR